MMQNAGLPLCELRNYVLQVEGTQGTWYNTYQAQALKEYEYLRKPMRGYVWRDCHGPSRVQNPLSTKDVE